MAKLDLESRTALLETLPFIGVRVSSTRGMFAAVPPNKEAPMVIVLFEHRLRADIDQDEWQQTFTQMVGLAAEMPGFVSINGFAGEDGSGLAVVRFESDEDVQAWKAHPDHVDAQKMGREAFFESYHMTVAGPIIREYGFPEN